MAKEDPTIKKYNLIKVVNPHKEGGFVLIAEHEFDEAVHKLWEAVADGAKKVEDTANAHLDGKVTGTATLDLSKMNVPQMKEFAKANSIDLGGAQSRADITKILDVWVSEKKAADDANAPK